MDEELSEREETEVKKRSNFSAQYQHPEAQYIYQDRLYLLFRLGTAKKNTRQVHSCFSQTLTTNFWLITVFPHIVSAETILFWISQYIRPKVTVHKCAETIQGWKLYEEIRCVFCTFCELEIVFVLICRNSRTISGSKLVQNLQNVRVYKAFCSSEMATKQVYANLTKQIQVNKNRNDFLVQTMSS